jgi:hypothetical protein
MRTEFRAAIAALPMIAAATGLAAAQDRAASKEVRVLRGREGQPSAEASHAAHFAPSPF